MSDAMGLPGMPLGGSGARPLFLGAQGEVPRVARPVAAVGEAADAGEAFDEDHIPGIAVPASLEKLLGFGRTFSWWPLLFGLACCAIEMMATAGPRFDMSRFGMEAMRASPRQADGMIVAGWCSIKMAPRVVRLYEQIPDPKWVLAMGSCAISGNIWDTYNIVQGIDALIPVDVYVPGCPPRPEALWQGLELLRGRVKQSRHAYDGLRRIPARVASGE